MPDIFERREKFSPAEYPEFVRYHEAALQSPWAHTEVSMTSDILDWENLVEADKKAIAGILKGFTLIESYIGEYWSDVVAKTFPKHEIIAMARTFSHQETIHQYAYDRLEASLGLDTYEAFKNSKTAQNKVAVWSNPENYGSISDTLAIFSAGGEGVSLFGSFAILLSFAKVGLLKGMQQLISWSCRDEALHSKAGIALYHQLIKEDPSFECNKETVYDQIAQIVKNELAFVKSAFNNGDLTTITYAEVKAFVKYRANLKLKELFGENTAQPYSKEEVEKAYNILEWFAPLTQTTVYGDFFALSKNGSAYAAILKKDFVKDVNFEQLFAEE